jgi:hypothetical protein
VIGLSAAKMEELDLSPGNTVLVKGKNGRWAREGGREERREGRRDVDLLTYSHSLSLD